MDINSGIWFCALELFNLLGKRDKEASRMLTYRGLFDQFVLRDKDILSHKPALESATFMFVRKVRDLPWKF